MRSLPFAAALLSSAAALSAQATPPPPQHVLVYEGSTVHALAQSAALALSPGGVVTANEVTFNQVLSTSAWDVVVLECSGGPPIGGWDPVIAYVNGGGAAILAFWGWTHPTAGGSALQKAFDVQATGDIVLAGHTLQDLGASGACTGVTTPMNEWHSHGGHGTYTPGSPPDGAAFVPKNGAQALVLQGSTGDPAVLVRGNGGRTIAAPVLDQAGDTWLADGSALQLWTNLIAIVTDPGPRVLVYDHDTHQSLAAKAAFVDHPGVVIGKANTFNALLTAEPWDAVLVDCPGLWPSGGWTDFKSYVDAGGRAVFAFWDWIDLSGVSGGLAESFDATALGLLTLSGGGTLFDSGTSDVFAGVTMPVSDWFDAWSYDGARLAPHAPAVGLAHTGLASEPAFVWGNAGRTIAASALDEAGPTWGADGSGEALWRNMLAKVLGTPGAATPYAGVLGLNPNDLTAGGAPVVDTTFTATVATAPTSGTLTLATYLVLGLGGATQGVPAFGYELLVLPTYLLSSGFGAHAVPVPPDPLLVGVSLAAQGGRLEQGGAGLVFVLTNGLSLSIGG